MIGETIGGDVVRSTVIAYHYPARDLLRAQHVSTWEYDPQVDPYFLRVALGSAGLEMGMPEGLVIARNQVITGMQGPAGSDTGIRCWPYNESFGRLLVVDISAQGKGTLGFRQDELAPFLNRTRQRIPVGGEEAFASAALDDALARMLNPKQ